MSARLGISFQGPLLLLCASLGAAAACSDPGPGGEGGGGSAGGTSTDEIGCPDDLQFFQEQVFGPILGQECIVCHAEGGLASDTKLVLDPAGTEEALAVNFEAARAVARTALDGTSVLLLRPTGLHPEGHTGGDLVPVGSQEYAALSAFVDRVTLGKCDGATTASCDGPARGGRLLRRLSRSEYDATIQDLFGFPSAWGAAFTSDTVVNGFDNNASALVVSPLLADQAGAAAEEIAAVAFGNPSSILPCDPAAAGEAECAALFIDTFGKRAFRRPLDEADRSRYLALHTTVASQDGFLEGAKTVMTAMLQSPHFLYRAELGGAAKDGVVTLTPHEVASELSYLFWGTMPDDLLFAAADAGQLSTTDQIESQAERLLADPRSDAVLDRFVDQWLLVSNVVNVPKDEALYPGFDAGIRSAMRQETRAVFRSVLRGESPTLPALFSVERTFVSPALASFYGLSGGAAGPDGLLEVDLSGTERIGILTQGSVLSTHAHPTDSSPIHRGKLVRTRVLCQDLPPPPAGFNVQPPPLDPSLTTRERYTEHSSEEPCKSCHRLIDPIGFGFERFDGVGRYRETENGKLIDASGEIVGSALTNGTFDGTAGLAATLAESPDSAACYSRQWLRFAYGIAEGPDTQCLATQVAKDFTEGGLRLDTFLLGLTRTRHFTERAADPDVKDPGGQGTGEGGGGGAGEGGSGSGAGEGGAGQGGSPATGQLTVTVQEDSHWGAGYCSTVKVQNTSDVTVTWEITLDVDGTITDLWNAVSEPAGTQTKFVGLDYNAVLDPAEAASFGFCASL
jgi:hypothetical protein